MADETLIELEPDRLGPRGDAAARDADGKPIYVAGAIPGERVLARVYKTGHVCTGTDVVEILRPSPHRVKPPCPLFGHCNGCQLQHVDYAHQLVLKRGLVAEALREIGGFVDPPLGDVLPAPSPWHYRNHARFTVKHGRLGFVRRQRRAFFEVPTCLLMEPRIDALLQSLQGRLHETTQCNIRVGAAPTSISIQPRLSLEQPASGQAYVVESLGGREFRVSTPAFFQVHRAQAERMAALVCDAVTAIDARVAVDAFAGVGTFAALLAASVEVVIAIEESGPAVRDAAFNFGGLSNVVLRLGKAELVLPALVAEGFAIDAVILDPPRSGCLPASLDAVIALAPRRVVYVSCDPLSLARDLRLLCDHGYVLTQVQPLDMFPHTAHVESIAVLDSRARG